MPGVTTTRKRNVPAPRVAWQGEIDDHVIALAWSPDGGTLAAAAIGGPIWLFDGGSGRVRSVLSGHGFGTSAVSWSADGALLASGGQDGVVRIWDPATGTAQATLQAGASWVERVVWSPRTSLRIWNDRGELVRAFSDHPSTIADLAWKPGADEVCTAHYGGLTIFAPDRDQPLVRHEWQGSTLVLAWSPDARFIATGDQDATVHFWIARTGKDLQMWGYPMKVRELAWSNTSRFLATGGGDAIVIWDCSGKGPENTEPLMLKGHDAPLACLTWQSRGMVLAAGDRAGRVGLWQPTRSKQPLAVTDYTDEIAHLAWAPDDRRIALGTSTGTVDVLALP